MYTVALSGLYPDKVVLALEIREKVRLVWWGTPMVSNPNPSHILPCRFGVRVCGGYYLND